MPVAAIACSPDNDHARLTLAENNVSVKVKPLWHRSLRLSTPRGKIGHRRRPG